MPTQTQIRQQVTDKVIQALESRKPFFWRQPWATSQNAGYPTNAATGNRYQGVNLLLLSLVGHGSKWWATYNQWRALGGQVRRGEKSTEIILYKPMTKKRINDNGDEEVRSFPLLKTWSVFHISQVDGDLDQFQESNRSDAGAKFVDYGPAEEAITATRAHVRFGGDRAFYSPGGDFIQMPPKGSFEKVNEFYGVLAHEVIHWTGYEHRLNRLNKLARFGDESYAVEELVAELGSAFLLSELNVPQSEELSNTIGYLDNWVKVLQRDHSAIFTASSAAAKAVDYVISFSRSTDDAESNSEIEAGAVAEE